MKRSFLALMVLIPITAQAQDVSPYPICTKIVNKAGYVVRGTVSTAAAMKESGEGAGTMARHFENFRIDPDQTMDICTQGPFYEGQKVELTLRTLIPVFQCYTALTGPIEIFSERDADGELKTWATCY